MKISALDVRAIQSNEAGIEVRSCFQYSTVGLYIAVIELWRSGAFDHEIKRTRPLFASEEEALAWANGFVQAIRELPIVS